MVDRLGMFVALLFVSVSINAALAEVDIECVTENYPPYNFRNDDGEIVGTSTAIVKSVLKEAGLSCNMTVMPWARAFWLAQEKPNHLIFTMVRTLEREKKFQWIRPLVNPHPVYFYRLAGNEAVVVPDGNLDAAKAYTIGVLNQSSVHEFVKRHQFPKVVTFAEFSKAFVLLGIGKIELTLMPSSNADDFIKQGSGKKKLKNLGIEKASFDRLYAPWEITEYMAFGLKTDPALVKRLQSAYDRLLKKNAIRLPE